MSNIQSNDEQSEFGRALPTVSSQLPSDGSTFGGAPVEKPTLYLGTFQILAMPFSSGQIPPNLSTMPSIAPPSKRD